MRIDQFPWLPFCEFLVHFRTIQLSITLLLIVKQLFGYAVHQLDGDALFRLALCIAFVTFCTFRCKVMHLQWLLVHPVQFTQHF